MIRVASHRGSIRSTETDLLVFFVAEGKETLPGDLATLQKLIGEQLIPPGGTAFAGKEGQTLLLFPKKLKSPRLLLVGLGKNPDVERFRRAAAVAAKAAQEMHLHTAALMEPDPALIARLAPLQEKKAPELYGSAVAEGAILGLYKFTKYISPDNSPPGTLRKILIVTESPSRQRIIARGAALAEAVCEATCFARDLANAPGNEIYPETLANAARASGRRSGFRVRVLDERKIRALNMGGLLGVSRGSRRPPRFVIMEYRGRGAPRRPVVLVGKGVTFDSGGISIKPSAGMAEMKMDMAGGAAVIGTLQAAARLKLPVNLVGLVPATENLPGGAALKPGDILRHHNGVTTEVDNTDAEGRLILADSLSYASRFSPELVIDLATLTGAVVVALGHEATGMMGNNAAAMLRLKEAGERSHERVWELPMFEEYEKLIKSDVADVKNVGGRWAGAITAAMFLKKFIGSYPWVHLDIAGTAALEEPLEYIGRGGSGVGVRLLIEFLRHWKNGQ